MFLLFGDLAIITDLHTDRIREVHSILFIIQLIKWGSYLNKNLYSENSYPLEFINKISVRIVLIENGTLLDVLYQALES